MLTEVGTTASAMMSALSAVPAVFHRLHHSYVGRELLIQRSVEVARHLREQCDEQLGDQYIFSRTQRVHRAQKVS